MIGADGAGHRVGETEAVEPVVDGAVPAEEPTGAESRVPASGGARAGQEVAARRGPSRRGVLKAIGVGGGAVLLAGVAGVGVRAVTNGVWGQGEGDAYLLWDTWQDVPGLAGLVAAGALAANPHNTQPWQFVVDGDRVEVHADRARDLVVNDTDGRERQAGLGCAVQNMVVAARSRGQDVQVEAWPDGADGPVARLRVTEGAAPDEAAERMAAAVARRHTDRGPYEERAVTDDVLTDLAGEELDGAQVHWVTEPERMAALGDLLVEATQAIVDDEEMSVESYRWMRYDRGQVDRERDGMTLDCQGMDGFTLFWAKVLPGQSRGTGDAYWVSNVRDVHTATAAAYGVVRVDDVVDPAQRVAGGRLLQRVHLAATVAGVAVHHMNQVTECIARDAGLGVADRFGADWERATGLAAGESLLAFRVGYPQRTAHPSPRRELAEVLTEV